MAEAGSDVVVIGAGFGGLAAALRLAAEGLSVTLLDRADAPGGKARAVASTAGPVDAGPTVMTLRGVFEDLFAQAGVRLADRVALSPEPLLARHAWPDGGRLDLWSDAARNARAIAAFAGAGDAAAFRGFDAACRRLLAAFDAPVMRSADPSLPALAARVLRQPRLFGDMAPHLGLARSLMRRFDDPRLAQLFGRYATYTGGAPDRAPALLALIWAVESAGVWRAEGGIHGLAKAIAALAAEKGCVLRLGAGARAIEADGGRASAVRLACGTRLPCRAIVFNGDPLALAEGRLGDWARRAIPRRGTGRRGHSAWVWSFAARARGFDLAHHNVFFGAEPFAEFACLRAGAMPADPTIYVCAQDRGTGRALPEGAERFEIILNAPPTNMAGPRITDSEERSRCRHATFRHLARFGLEFDPVPKEAALTTPRDFAARFPGSAGSLYGPSPQGLTAALARPRARSRLPGLYLAGGGTHPGPGIPMATLSGRHAAEAILTDLASTSPFRRTATPGGISTASPRNARTASRGPSPSSAS